MSVRVPFHSLRNMLGMITMKCAFHITAAVLSLASCAAKKGWPPRNGDKHADRQCRTVHTPSPTTTKNIYRIRKHLSCGVQPKVRGREAVMRRYCVYNRLGMRECNSISARMNDGAEKKWCEETVNNVDLSPEAPSPLSLPPPHSLFTSLLATSTDLVRQFLPVVVLITQFIETEKSWIHFMHLLIARLYLRSKFNHVHIFCLSCSNSTHLWGLCERLPATARFCFVFSSEKTVATSPAMAGTLFMHIPVVLTWYLLAALLLSYRWKKNYTDYKYFLRQWGT